MADVNALTTNQLPGDTNRYVQRELYRSSTSITPLAQTTGYKLTSNIDLSHINAGRIIPNIEVYIDDTSGGTSQFTKCPMAEVDTNGNVLRSVSVAPFNDTAKGGGYVLGVAITYFHRTSNSAKTFYYRVMSGEAGVPPGGSWTS